MLGSEVMRLIRLPRSETRTLAMRTERAMVRERLDA